MLLHFRLDSIIAKRTKDFAKGKKSRLRKLLVQCVPEVWRKSYGTLGRYIEVHRSKQRHWTSRRARARGTGSALVVESAASRYTSCIRSSLSSSSSRTQSQVQIYNAFWPRTHTNDEECTTRRRLMAQEGRDRNSFRAKGPSAEEKNVSAR